MSYSHHEKELKQLMIREQRFLAKRRNKKESAINRVLADKIPDKLQSTINTAFSKAFSLIFDKGTPIIEMTYKKDELEKDFQIDLFSARLRGTKKSLKKLSSKADIAGGVNLAVSGASGIGMGLLGMGLPDIPVFTAMILRCVYEVAIRYGFDYETEEEKYNNQSFDSNMMHEMGDICYVPTWGTLESGLFFNLKNKEVYNVRNKLKDKVKSY